MAGGDDHEPGPEPLISVVLPVYNEERVLEALCRSVLEAVASAGCRAELIFVDDGSRDSSGAILDRLAGAAPEVRVIHFARNFGHQAAVQAGLEHAGGDAVVVMDSDLQDDPGSISRFVAAWRDGYDVVYAIRTGRKEGPLKRLLFFAFYRVLNRVSKTSMPADAGNFGLLDGGVAREVARLQDRDRYFAGLRSWVGHRQIGVEVERGPRYDGRPRVSFLGLWRLAMSAIFSFSSFPLTIFYAIGSLSMLVFAGLACFILYHKIFTHLAIPGWASGTMTSSFFGALNAMGIAVLGEYVTRIYDQVRSRPLYLIERRVNFPEDPAPSDPERGTDMLAHSVYFSLRDRSEAAVERLVGACRTYLTDHPGVVYFGCGTLEPTLTRPVNDLDFDVALIVVFASKEAHDAYQEAPRHLQFIAENRETWAKVRVFDAAV